MKLLLAILIASSISPIGLAQRRSKPHGKLDRNKPSVFISFVRAGQIEPLETGVDRHYLWFRITNNMRYPIWLDGSGVPKEYGDARYTTRSRMLVPERSCLATRVVMSVPVSVYRLEGLWSLACRVITYPRIAEFESVSVLIGKMKTTSPQVEKLNTASFFMRLNCVAVDAEQAAPPNKRLKRTRLSVS